MKQQQIKIADLQAAEAVAYDSRPLAAALAALSRAEIETMLANIASLETQIAKLSRAGHEDEMMHLVTDGLRRLTYFLDAVVTHKDHIGAQSPTTANTASSSPLKQFIHRAATYLPTRRR